MVGEPVGEDVIRGRIRIHLAGSRAAVDALVDVHERVGHTLGSTLETEERGTAIWELAGHALALARAYLFLLDAGYAPAAGVQARAIHEALLALAAIADPLNNEVPEQYFADHDLKPEGIRRSVQKAQKRIKAAGAETRGDMRTLANGLYSGLSGYAHNRRRAVREAVSEPPVVFAYGPNPSVDIVAAHVSYATDLIVHLSMEVASCLSLFTGFENVERDVGRPLINDLKEVDRVHSLMGN